MMRVEAMLRVVSSLMCSSGDMGVRRSKWGRLREPSGSRAVDGLDADEAEVSLAVLGGPDLSGDVVAGPEAEAPDLGLGDVDVAGAGVAAVGLEEAVAVAGDGEDAVGEDLAVSVGEAPGGPSS